MPPYSRAEDNVQRLADAGEDSLGGHRRPEPGDRVRSKPAPGARTPRPVRHQPGAGPGGGGHGRTGTSVRPRRPRTCRGRAARGPGPWCPVTRWRDITATRAIERIWRGGIACDRRASSRALPKLSRRRFDAQLAKVVAAVRDAGPTIRRRPPRAGERCVTRHYDTALGAAQLAAQSWRTQPAGLEVSFTQRVNQPMPRSEAVRDVRDVTSALRPQFSAVLART